MKKNLLKIPFMFICICIFITSCSNESYFEIGSSWVDQSLKLVYIDSCRAKLSTLRIDSVPTYNQGVILAGKYEDINTITGEKLTGTIKATSYIEISSPSVTNTTNLRINTFFDSIVIEMKFSGYYMGDTLNHDMHLFVHQLEERISEKDVAVGSEMFYNTTSFAYNPKPLAEAFFPIRPSDSAAHKVIDGGIIVKPLRMRLPDYLGQEMFDKIANSEDEFDSNEKFLDYFKGLVFVAGDDVETIVGFKADTSFKMNLYYHVQEEFATNKMITFSLNASKQFNNISSDRNGTDLLPDLFTENEIESHLTGNQAFIAAGDGLYTKIEFPNLHDILLLSTYGIVEAATLEIRPVFGTYQKYTPLPLTLSISASSISGESESALTDTQGQSQSGNLTFDPQFWDNTLYRFDVTSFIQNQMQATANQKMYLILKLSGSEMQNSTQRLVIGDNDHSIDVGSRTYYNRIKLAIYYNMYNDQN
jgi:hypothetical protein